MVQVYLDCGLFYLANEKCSQVAIRNLCDTRYDLISETSAMWKRFPWNWKLPVSLGKWCYWRPLKGLILRNCALQYDSMAQRRDGLKDPLSSLPPRHGKQVLSAAYFIVGIAEEKWFIHIVFCTAPNPLSLWPTWTSISPIHSKRMSLLYPSSGYRTLIVRMDFQSLWLNTESYLLL